MTGNTRKHHYLPQFYLAGFTESGNRGSFLWWLDRINGECRRSKPVNVAVQRDYYRVNIPGLNTNFMENYFARIENHVSILLQKINKEHKILEEGEFEDLIAFVTQIYLRTPKWRQFMRKSLLDATDLQARMLLSKKERWERTIEQFRQEGGEFPDAYTYEEMKKAYEEGEIFPSPNQEFEMMCIIWGTIELTPILMARKWSLLISNDPHGGFVTSDAALTPFWNKPGCEKFPMGFALNSVDVLFPLSNHLCLLGCWDMEPKTLHVNENMVAFFNKEVMFGAERYVYCSSPDCPALMPNETVGTAEALLNLIKINANANKKSPPVPRK